MKRMGPWATVPILMGVLCVAVGGCCTVNRSDDGKSPPPNQEPVTPAAPAGSQQQNVPDPPASSGSEPPASSVPPSGSGPTGSQPSAPATDPHAESGTATAPGSAVGDVVETDSHQTFLAAAQKRLEAVNADLTQLEKKLETATAELRERYENEWKPKLVEKREEAQALLTKIRTAESQEWETLKAELQTSLDNLKSLFDSALEQLK